MLENHVIVETKMLNRMQEAMENTDDEALKLLFQHIVSDEKKHHKIMKTIIKKAFKIKIIS